MPRTHRNRHGDRASRDDDPPPAHLIGSTTTALRRRQHRTKHQVIEGSQRTRNATEREPAGVATVNVYLPGLSVRPFTRRPRENVRG